MKECCGQQDSRISRRAIIAGLLGASASLAVRGSKASAASDQNLVTVAPGLQIRRRGAWGSTRPPAGRLFLEPEVRFLLVHHTAGSNDYSATRVASQIQQIYDFHTGTKKKWPDVCYNFFVDRFGGIWEGRQGSIEGPVAGDATGGSQGFAQLVCLLGNFETARPSTQMMESCANLLAWLAGRYEILVDQNDLVSFTSKGSNRWKVGTLVTARPISGHRDMSATLCPGKNVYPLLESWLPMRVRHYQTLQAPKP